ncbi:MAG: BolA family transcriptional regulator [Paraglaciecola sp.]|jgi:acid stress-induced BolA-like protein IbaG/YrbA|nr:BolA family transcriptional regulator [Paraglaciecola sp.]NCT46987.1 BolA family transcriptional regulator [Paraglaciecola sp.]
MENHQIEALLKDQLGLSEVYVKSDGSHFNIIAVSDKFADMSRVKKQQFVYAPLAAEIASGNVHAVSIKTFTDAQWKREKLFNMP